jgi:hypothetical protein
MQSSSVTPFSRQQVLRLKEAETILETERVWDALKASYFKDFCAAETDEQLIEIRLKVAMIGDLRGAIRRLANSGEIDNAG